jgi:ubiquinone/menaquinone biosynthesis C-methylase UbiE
MMVASSYDPDHLGRTFDEETERLRAQVALSWPMEQRRLSMLGIVNGKRVVEPGCGPGFVTERLARFLPDSRITALDNDRRMLGLARRNLENQGLNRRVELVEAAAEATGLASGVFDAAISRYLFQHLPDPVAAATEIRRILRRGGVHIIIDIDDGLWGIAEPNFKEFAEWHARRASAQQARGGNRFRGRSLARILRQAGYARVVMDVFACHSDDVGIDAFATQIEPDQFIPLLEDGLLTVADYARAKALYKRFRQSPGSFVLAIGFIAYGENPL